MSKHNLKVLEEVRTLLKSSSLIVETLGDVPNVLFASVKSEMIYSVRAIEVDIWLDGFIVGAVVLLDNKEVCGFKQVTITVHKVTTSASGKQTSQPILNQSHDFYGSAEIPSDVKQASDALSKISYALKNNYVPWRASMAWELSEFLSTEDVESELALIDKVLPPRYPRHEYSGASPMYMRENESLVVVSRDCYVKVEPCAVIAIGTPYKVIRYFQIKHFSGTTYVRIGSGTTTNSFFENFLNRLINLS